MNQADPNPGHADPAAPRAAWLRVLARAPAEALQRLARPVLADYRFETLRAPESGLVMVRARIGNTGDRYHLGEATVTRCAVRHRVDAHDVVAGVGHVLGLDARRAETVAQLDALLQRPALHARVMQGVVEPLDALDRARCADEVARTEATRVRFYTLQPEHS